MPLALDLVQRFNRELKKNFTGFTTGAAQVLEEYPWPGNIRELKNVIERTMILAREGNIDASSLPQEIQKPEPIDQVMRMPFTEHSAEESLQTLRELEEDYIQRVLVATGNNKTHAARILGIHPTSLLRRLKKEPVLS